MAYIFSFFSHVSPHLVFEIENVKKRHGRFRSSRFIVLNDYAGPKIVITIYFMIILELFECRPFSSVPLSSGESSIPGVFNSCLVHPLARCVCGS